MLTDLEDDTMMTEAEADRFDAYVAGERRTEQEWILSDRDVWYKNPHFTGIPSNRHPEDDF